MAGAAESLLAGGGLPGSGVLKTVVTRGGIRGAATPSRCVPILIRGRNGCTGCAGRGDAAEGAAGAIAG
ncbi:MAG TPA: hypothetical protein VHX65_15190 [Pirellulales bacterium]|jgi:hypothetical protein|nr:hypothetical protein [Pirellulales bacterium]